MLDDDRAGEPVCALLIKQIAKIPQRQHLKVFIETPAHSDGDLAAERTCIRAARIPVNHPPSWATVCGPTGGKA